MNRSVNSSSGQKTAVADSAYDFTFTREIKDALSIAPSRAGGGRGGSISSRSHTPHTPSSKSPTNPRPWTSVGDSDAFSVAASTSMSQLANRAKKENNLAVESSGNESSPADVVGKDLEKEINQLIEKTIILRKEGRFDDALDCAKEGTKKEKLLRKRRHEHSLSSGPEILNAAWFNLASAYEVNDMPDDAIKTYNYLVAQRGNPCAGRVRINMGNVHYRQKQYPTALKMYKMGLDQTNRNDDKSMAHKILRNIGNAYFRMGEIRDAVKYFEEAMSIVPDYQTGFNLLVCHVALDDLESAKKDFVALLDIPSDQQGEETLVGEENTVLKHKDEPDELALSTKQADHFLRTAARVIAPVLDSSDWSAGYDWVCNALADRHEELSHQLKLEQASQRLHHKDFNMATKSLKSLQKKGKEVQSVSATNLSFVSFLEGDIERASEYADVALASNRYNAKALVNKGNCLFVNGDFTAAKDLYIEAIGIQTDSSQAIFNLGLANAQLGLAEEAIHAFKQVHEITPNDPQVLFQIADIYDLQGRSQDAMKWFNILSARVQNDPAILSRLGQVYANAEDDSQSLHCRLESFRHYPTDLDVIGWIGSWFVQQEMFERSCYFFQQASLIQPKEIKWGFMSASAHKRCGANDAAFHEYERLLDQARDPLQRIECLRCLVATCESVGKASYPYQERLDKLISES